MSDTPKRQRPTLARPVAVRPSRSTPVSSPVPLLAPVAMLIERDGHVTATPLVKGERFVLGRHDAADLVFNDDAVSRLHGVLSVSDAAVTFEDYGSHNGSVVVRGVDTTTLTARTPHTLWAGDVLELGGGASVVRFTAQLPEAAAAARDADAVVSAAARQFADRLRLAGKTRVPVFLLGPSGVGKTHSARTLHELSRLPGAFVPINCARLATDPNALHSELLGHVRGAYTGADAARTGKFVQADGGTLFLDEVESLPAIAQGFLLDVLEGSGDLSPLGAQAVRLKPLTFRLVSASKRPLGQSGLRADLCERLAEGHLWRVPGLSERQDDIPGLMQQFAREQSTLLGVTVTVDAAAIAFARTAPWPGQIRQLRATVTALAQLGLAKKDGVKGRAVTVTEAELRAHLRERDEAFDDDAPPVRGDARRLTQAQVEAALEVHGGNQVKAAKALGIARNTLRKFIGDSR